MGIDSRYRAWIVAAWIVLFGWCVAANGQDIPLVRTIILPQPNADYGSVRVTLFNARNRPSKWVLPLPHKTTDRSFWFSQIASEGATIADVENTQYCLRSNTCLEGNPLFFSKRPSRVRMYTMTSILNVFAGYMAYREKRKQDAEIAFGVNPGKPRWFTLPFMVTGSHIFGTAFTLAATGR